MQRNYTSTANPIIEPLPASVVTACWVDDVVVQKTERHVGHVSRSQIVRRQIFIAPEFRHVSQSTIARDRTHAVSRSQGLRHAHGGDEIDGARTSNEEAVVFRDESTHRDRLGVAHFHRSLEHAGASEQNLKILSDSIYSDALRYRIERVFQSFPFRFLLRVHDAAADSIEQPAPLWIGEKQPD